MTAPRVLVSPFAGGSSVNPYLDLLSGALTEAGVSIGDFGRRNVLAGDVDVVHVHWPERMVGWQRSAARVLVDAVIVLGVLMLAKARGVRLVWTAHNVSPHSATRPRAYAAFFAVFVRMVDLVIVLSESSEEFVRSAHRPLLRTPFVVVPHGHYRDHYPPPVPRSEARRDLDLDPDSVTFLCFGLIRRYKNVDGLVRVFLGDASARIARDEETLVVAGSAHDPVLGEELRSLVGSSDRVRLMLEQVPDPQVAVLHGATDVVVLAYSAPSVLNSGAALLGLSLDRPVVVPDTPAMRDLQKIVGDSWMRVFTGGPEDALAAARTLAGTVRVGRPPLDSLDWDVIAQRCRSAYELVGPRGSRGLRSRR